MSKVVNVLGVEEVVSVNEDDGTDYDLVYMTDPRTGVKSLRGGTLDKFIIKITASSLDDHDHDFVATFLLTYRSFTKPLILFKLLRQRYGIVDVEPPLKKITDVTQLQPIRLRVFNFLKTWLSQYTYEFTENGELMEKLNDFIQNDMKKANMAGPAKVLEKILEKNRLETIPISLMEPRGALNIPSIDVMELARQLTLHEHYLYCKIKPWECFKAGWTKSSKETLSPNISRFISHFNNVSMWVATEVVRQQTVKQRSATIQQFISLGKKLKGLQNFNGCMEVVAGLEQASISRLKVSWGEISSSAQKAFTDISNFVKASDNYKNLREACSTLEPPLIPYIGIYLSDLVFLEEGNPDFLWAQEGFINFYKCNKIATVIKSLQLFQAPPYNFSPIPKFQGYVSNLQPLTEDQLYKYSYQVLPLGKTAETDRDGEQQLKLNEMFSLRYGTEEEPSELRDSGKNKLKQTMSRLSRKYSMDGGSFPTILRRKVGPPPASLSRSTSDLNITKQIVASNPFSSEIDDSDDVIPRCSSLASTSDISISHSASDDRQDDNSSPKIL